MEKGVKGWINRIVFMSPAMLIYLIFMIIPIIYSFYYSIFQWDGVSDKEFIGFDNYFNLTKDAVIYKTLMNSGLLTFWALVIQLPVGLLLAVLLSRQIKRGIRFFKTVFFLPVVLSTSVVGVLWGLIYDPNVGLLNQVLSAVGLDDWTRVWLGETESALNSIIAVVSWQYIGFYMVVYYAALQNVPDDVLEAAKMDGASEYRLLFQIKIPLIWHVINFTIIYCIVNSLKYFDLIYIMTNGGPNGSSEVIASYMFKQAFRFYDFGYASTISIFLFLLGVLLAIVLNKLFRREAVEY
ncbi:carbohydrate ABC transporter permease [Paenibacillus sp. JSM ZJ436]|uniref:Putative ABC-type sugar transport system, permease component n=1 Tax=Paenibacillus algicola TaxID=2565926 RepID=A0A4P8XGQ6_9BACL|nr:sugar ABC transporter permease [Paenibacillus algicola]QCT01515.1 putative ABC-type sugar transport system, permease component [Paenibacillus algicola]